MDKKLINKSSILKQNISKSGEKSIDKLLNYSYLRLLLK